MGRTYAPRLQKLDCPYTAALFGNTDMVKFLIEAGPMNAEMLGDTLLSATEMDELSTILLAEMMGMQVSEEQLPDDREEDTVSERKWR